MFNHAQSSQTTMFHDSYYPSNPSVRTISLNTLHSTKSLTGDFCVTIQIHKIIQNGNSVDNTTLLSQINQLNNYFAANGNSGITFVANETIIEHQYSAIFSNDLFSGIAPEWNNIIGGIGQLDDPNRIDLYFSPNNYGGGGSATPGVGIYTNAFIAYDDLNSPWIAHLVAHTLGVYHTYHGTFGNGSFNFENYCFGQSNGSHGYVECPSPPISGGDFVANTVADTNEYTVPFNCTAQQPNQSGYCSNANFPNVNMNNIMRFSQDLACGSFFTSGQINRMKYFLANDLSSLVDACPNPVECNECGRTSNYYAQKILFESTQEILFPPSPSVKYLDLNCNSITINALPFFNEPLPQGVEDCEYEYFLKIPGSTEFVPYTSLIGQTINFTGDSTTILKLTDGNGNDVCCYEINCNTPYTSLQGNGMNNLQVECPIICENPCDLEADYTYQAIGSCNYQFTAVVDLPCSIEEYNFQWYINGSYISSGLTSILNLSGLSNPTVAFQVNTAGLKCKYIKKILPISCFAPSLTINPNPVKSLNDLEFGGLDYKDISSIEIYDIRGNLKQIIKPKRNSFKIEKLTSGMYFIRFTTKQGTIQKKLIIE